MPLVTALAVMALSGAQLPRRNLLGAELSASDATVSAVDPRYSTFPIRAGDVILDVAGQAVADGHDVAMAVARQRQGSRGRLTVERQGRRVELSGRWTAARPEAFSNGDVDYGAAPFDGGLLRTLVARPRKAASGEPILFLMQGYTCGSIELARNDAPLHRLVDGLLERGIGVYRVEKPGVGDSRGGKPCEDIDFEDELAAYEAGYRALRETLHVPPERILLFGISMGGIQAPLIAARGPRPRGVAVWGVTAHPWYDYMVDTVRLQAFRSGRRDPAAAEADGEALRPVLGELLLNGTAPQVLARDAGMRESLRGGLQWDGGTRLFGRDVRYWQQLAAVRPLAAWRDARLPVLAMEGGGDLAATEGDADLVARTVNHYRPGTAEAVAVPRTGHGFTLDGDREEIRRRNGAAKDAPFNAAVVSILSDWVGKVMAGPMPSA